MSSVTAAADVDATTSRAGEPVRAGGPGRRRGGARQQRRTVPRAGQSRCRRSRSSTIRRRSTTSRSVGDADPQGPDARNLWRVHWYNDLAGNRVDVPDHVVLPSSLTGVESPIIVVFGDRFPMITAHKVLAAYSCLAPRVVTGQFDPTHHRAIWPSTGNYARGGIAISRIMASRGVAILPEGMSQERFDWLDEWCANPAEDVIRTHGTESNVKEIYDACNELAPRPGQLRAQPVLRVRQPPRPLPGHRAGRSATSSRPSASSSSRRVATCNLAAFTSATGSAGTIAAGDRLKEEYGTKIVAVEALECPTMLENGFGEHNIQGIGDKHIPLIHNVMNTDVVVGDLRQGDRRTRRPVQHRQPGGATSSSRRAFPPTSSTHSNTSGSPSICNVLAAIKTAKLLDLGPDDAHHHRRHRRRRAVPERARQAARHPLRRRVHHHRRRRGVRRAPRLTSAPTT